MSRTVPPYIVILAMAVIAIVVGIVLLLTSPSKPSDVEARAREIEQKLVCPVCPNQVLAGSDNQIAKDMRALIRKKLADGESKKQIVQYFVDRYGVSVLAAPPKRGLDLTVWLAPVFAFVAGGAILYVAWRSRRRAVLRRLRPKEEQ